ncbi:hypothetical protein C0991_000456, partial [Blastosporella zonata]
SAIPASNSLNSPTCRVTLVNSVAGSSAGRQTNLADSDAPSPSAPSGATGVPSSLSASNSGTPEIPSPETSPSSSSAPSVGSAAGVICKGPATGPSSSSSTARAARVAGAAVLFALFLTTRARRKALEI